MGDAFVRIRPDTTTFATELKADVVAAAAAASASATSSAKSASSAAKEAGVSVRYLATATTALTQAQNANARAAKAAALALSQITGVTGSLAIAQERAARASALTVLADKAVQKSKLAVIAAEKTYAHAIATGETAVVASMEKSLLAARGAYALSEANLTAAQSHELKAKAAIADAKAEQAAAVSTSASAKASTGSLQGNMAAAMAQRLKPAVAGASASTAAAASTTTKATGATKALTQAQNLLTTAGARLTFINRAIVNTTNELAIANIRAQRAEAAVLAGEAAVTAARKVGNAALIQKAELVHVSAVAEQTAAVKAVASAKAQVAATRELTAAQHLQAAAASKVAAVNKAVFGVTSELAAAQVVASRAGIAVGAAERAVVAARATGNIQLIRSTEATLAHAAAMQKDAAATLESASAQAVHASQLGFVRRGALASILSLVGVRGATLAANSAFLIGAAAIVTFAKSLSTFASFERQLNVLRVTTGATAEEMERVSDTAIQLGADITLPGVSASDAAEAMTELAKAGLSVQDALDGARGVLQLATAANISNADATTLAASALNAFGLAGNQAVRVADILASAANAAQGSIQDMGLSLQQAAAVGRQVGLSLEDTTVFLTSLTRAGIRGSDAGTSLRTALLRLVNPTLKAKVVLDELGVSIRDSQGNIRPDFFVNLGIALDGLGKKQRDARLAILGGADAIRALSILSRQSIVDLIGLRRQISEQGTAAEVASARTSGLAGAGAALSNVLENIGLSIGRSVGPGLTDFTRGLTEVIATVSTSENTTRSLADTLAIIGDGFQAIGAVMTTLALPAQIELVSSAITTIGVAEILAAVVAYKFLAPAIKSAAVASLAAATAFRAAAISSFSLSASLRLLAAANIAAAMAGMRAALLAFATSTLGVGLAVAALAGGLIFLITREDSTERATRRLKDSTDALQGSLSALTDVTDNLARANSSLRTEEIGVQSANLAVAQARQSLTNSTAARGSLERKQAENALTVALDNLRLAERRLADTRAEQSRLLREQSQAERNLAADRVAQVQSIEDLIDVNLKNNILSRERVADINERSPAFLLDLEGQAIEDITAKLRERADAEAALNTEASAGLAKRLNLIADIAATTGQLPSERAIDILIRAPNLKSALAQIAPEFGKTGKEAIAAFVASVTTDIPEAAKDLRFAINDLLFGIKESFGGGGQQSADVFWRAFLKGSQAQKEKVANAVADVIARSNAKISALEREALDLEIAGASPQEILANLRAKKAEQEKAVARQERRFQRGDIAIDQVTAAKEKLADTIGQIKTLEESIKGDADAAKREIQEARDNADQAVVDAFTSKRTRLENLLIRAGGTEGLGDDIKFNKALQGLLRNQIKLAGERIKNLEKRRDFIQETNRLILTIGNQIKADEARQKQLIAQQRTDRQQERDDKLQLNIEFAQITENAKAEIRARQARIRALQAQQRQLIKEKGQRAKNTAAYLELRNQVAREKAAIKDLRKEQEGMDKEAQKLIFQFLQTQQGFAANLLSNLFPSEFAGGNLPIAAPGAPKKGQGLGLSIAELAGLQSLGGGLGEALVRGPEGTLGPAAAVADARDRGPTSGQSNVQIDLLRKILHELRNGNKGAAHPEARHQRVAGGSRMDILS